MLGLFLSGMSSTATTDLSTSTSSIPLGKQVRGIFREMGQKTWSSARNFAWVSILFSSVECTVEKYRARTDSINTAVAGCFSGAVLARKSGLKGAAVGCIGFATFSTAMEYFMSERN